MESVWLLLVPPLLLRVVPFRPAHSQRFHPVGDLLLPLVVAVLGTWLQHELTTLRIGDTWATSDFAEYCATALGVADGGTADTISGNRSRMAAWLPAVLSHRYGVLDAFAVATWISVAVTNLGLWIWGRALHSRLAGTAAVVLLATLPMGAQFTRTLSFYPEVNAIVVLACGLACLAVRYRSPVTCLAAGVGMGLVLLIDVRGLPWAMALIPVCLLACLGLPWPSWRRPPLGRIGLCLLLFALPLCGSWFAAPHAYPYNAASLEDQTDIEQRYRDIGIPAKFEGLPDRPHFIYGRSPLTDLPATVHFLLAEGRAATERQRHDAAEKGRPTAEIRVYPWLPLGAASLLLTLLHLWRRPQVLLALAAGSLPFLLALQRTVQLLLSYERMVGQAQLLLAVFMGVAYAGLCLGVLPRDAGEQRSWPPAWPVLSWPRWAGRGWWGLAILVPLALVQHWVPSHLSPWASWRHDSELPEAFTDLGCLTDEAGGGAPCTRSGPARYMAPCVLRLRQDLEAGRVLYTEALFQAPEGD